MFLTSFVSGIKKSQGNITAALGYYIIKISEYENCILNITKILLILHLQEQYFIKKICFFKNILYETNVTKLLH